MDTGFSGFDVKNKINNIIGGKGSFSMKDKIIGKQQTKSYSMSDKILGKTHVSSSDDKIKKILGTQSKHNVTPKHINRVFSGNITNNILSKRQNGKTLNSNITNITKNNTKNIYGMGVWQNPEKIAMARMSQGNKIPRKDMFKDYDKDGYPNVLDCNPFNKNKHGFLQKAGNFVTGKGYQEPPKTDTNPGITINPKTIDTPVGRLETTTDTSIPAMEKAAEIKGVDTQSQNIIDYAKKGMETYQQAPIVSKKGLHTAATNVIVNPIKTIYKGTGVQKGVEMFKLKMKDIEEKEKKNKAEYEADLSMARSEVAKVQAEKENIRKQERIKQLKQTVRDEVKREQNPLGYYIGKGGKIMQGFVRGTKVTPAVYDQQGRPVNSPMSAVTSLSLEGQKVSTLYGGYKTSGGASTLLGGGGPQYQESYGKYMMGLGGRPNIPFSEKIGGGMSNQESLPFDVKMAMYTGRPDKARQLMNERNKPIRQNQILPNAPRQVQQQQSSIPPGYFQHPTTQEIIPLPPKPLPEQRVKHQSIVIPQGAPAGVVDAYKQGGVISPFSKRPVDYVRGPYRTSKSVTVEQNNEYNEEM